MMWKMNFRDLYQYLFEEEDGQGIVEYGLIIVLIVAALVGALHGLGKDIQNQYKNLQKSIQDVGKGMKHKGKS